MDDDLAKVRGHAAGLRKDYAAESAPLGTGGQAEVLPAVHKATGTEVALKRLTADTKQRTARMAREIEVGRAIDHPNVMPVLDAGPGANWCVMPRAEEDLERWRASHEPSDADICEILYALVNGLSAAHERGWVHRDVKPANILRLRRSVGYRWTIADWGLVRQSDEDSRTSKLTAVGHSYGSVGYAAPELQGDAHSATPATDVFSVGRVLEFVITGKRPGSVIDQKVMSSRWAQIVIDATDPQVALRPPSMAQLTELIDDECGEARWTGGPPPVELLARARGGDIGSLDDLLRSAATASDHGMAARAAAFQLDLADLVVAVHRKRHLLERLAVGLSDGRLATEDDSAVAVRFLLTLAKAAARAGELTLLGIAIGAMTSQEGWPDDDVQRDLIEWRETLSPAPVGAVDRALEV
jgi:Protein kinase domain